MENLNVFLLFLIFNAVNLPTGGTTAHSCPPGFKLYGKRCYTALDLHASWPEAKEYCTVLGGKLAAIASDYEQNIIGGIVFEMHGKISNEVYWMDGSNILADKKWRWIGDRGASVLFSYTKWYPGEPNRPDERCLEVRYDYNSQWNNAFCWLDRSGICEARVYATEGEIVNDTLQDP